MRIRSHGRRAHQTHGKTGTYLLTSLPVLLDPVKVERENRREARRAQGLAEVAAEMAVKAVKRHRFRVTPSGVCSDCLQGPDVMTTVFKRVSGGTYSYRVPLHTGEAK